MQHSSLVEHAEQPINLQSAPAEQRQPEPLQIPQGRENDQINSDSLIVQNDPPQPMEIDAELKKDSQDSLLQKRSFFERIQDVSTMYDKLPANEQYQLKDKVKKLLEHDTMQQVKQRKFIHIRRGASTDGLMTVDTERINNDKRIKLEQAYSAQRLCIKTQLMLTTANQIVNQNGKFGFLLKIDPEVKDKPGDVKIAKMDKEEVDMLKTLQKATMTKKQKTEEQD